jgi:hypothetical protein
MLVPRSHAHDSTDNTSKDPEEDLWRSILFLPSPAATSLITIALMTPNTSAAELERMTTFALMTRRLRLISVEHVLRALLDIDVTPHSDDVHGFVSGRGGGEGEAGQPKNE